MFPFGNSIGSSADMRQQFMNSYNNMNGGGLLSSQIPAPQISAPQMPQAPQMSAPQMPMQGPGAGMSGGMQTNPTSGQGFGTQWSNAGMGQPGSMGAPLSGQGYSSQNSLAMGGMNPGYQPGMSGQGTMTQSPNAGIGQIPSTMMGAPLSGQGYSTQQSNTQSQMANAGGQGSQMPSGMSYAQLIQMLQQQQGATPMQSQMPGFGMGFGGQ